MSTFYTGGTVSVAKSLDEEVGIHGRFAKLRDFIASGEARVVSEGTDGSISYVKPISGEQPALAE